MKKHAKDTASQYEQALLLDQDYWLATLSNAIKVGDFVKAKKAWERTNKSREKLIAQASDLLEKAIRAATEVGKSEISTPILYEDWLLDALDSHFEARGYTVSFNSWGKTIHLSWDLSTDSKME